MIKIKLTSAQLFAVDSAIELRIIEIREYLKTTNRLLLQGMYLKELTSLRHLSYKIKGLILNILKEEINQDDINH